jgi:hypothetical protein
MTASLADRRELARPLSAFAAFQGHFLSASWPSAQEFAPSLSPSIDSQQYIVRLARCEEAEIKALEA